MAGKVSGRSPPENCVPSGSKFADIETAQSRNLDVELLPIRRRRLDRNAPHVMLKRDGGSLVESLNERC